MRQVTPPALAILGVWLGLAASAGAAVNAMAPANKAAGINPDTQLTLTFDATPAIGKSGKIRIYDAADDRLVDTLDLSLLPGPTERTTLPQPPYLATPYPYDQPRRSNADTKAGTPTAGALPPPANMQLTIIGGFTDGFHFYPVIVRDKVARITPHHNLLAYGKTYYVQIDDGALTLADGSFHGIAGKNGWRFSTRPRGPAANAPQVVVAADGSGDFNTVQGAIDFIPERHAGRMEIRIRPGDYEEIVYARNKSDLAITGAGRDKVRIHYRNNEVFNPHPDNIGTNELAGTFPSRRAAMSLDNVSGIELSGVTVETTARGQAEGLLINGERNTVRDVTVIGDGDALQTNGSNYFERVKVVGGGDTILGRGAAFFKDCEIESKGTYMWIRNTDASHGNVFVDCRFTTRDGGKTDLARIPLNKGKAYPHAEAVLINATLSGIVPAGWGEIGGDSSKVRFWEFNSRHPDGTPVDVSQRITASRQLDAVKDAELIKNYSSRKFVLGW